MEIKKNFNLATLTTFKIPGRAEFFTVVKNEPELIQALRWAGERKLPVKFFSGGSNILLSRDKIKGLVIKISGEEYEIKKNFILAWTGIGLTKLTKISADAGLSGLEWAFGIPGSLGGAVRGNAGAYGSDISRSVLEVTAYDLKKNKILKISARTCGFAYRHSIFKKNKNLVILRVKLKLTKAGKAGIRKILEKNLSARLASNPKGPSAGCIFKNLEYTKILKQNRRLALDLKKKGLVNAGKVGIGYLIDQLGLKGLKSGGAEISQRHANFIINNNKAKLADVKKLINIIKKEIKHKYKITAEEEVQHFG